MEANINLRVFKIIVLMLIASMMSRGNALPTSLKLDPEPFITSTTVATNLDNSDTEIINASEPGAPQPPSPAPPAPPATDEQQQQQQQQIEGKPDKPSFPDQAPQDLQPTAPSALPPSSAQESLEGSPLGFLQRFDQRQNGTENYRIKVDGLVFILAPADSLLLAGAASLDPTFSSALGDKFKPTPAPSELDKPKPTKESIHKFASHQEAMRKSGVRINDLMPAFWNRLRQAQQANE